MSNRKWAVAAVFSLSLLSFAQQNSGTSGAGQNNPGASKNNKEPANILEQRAEYFARRHGTRPNKTLAVVRLKALKQLEQMRQKEKQQLQSSPQLQTGAAGTAGFSSLALSTTQWTSIGPAPLDASGGPFSGRVSALKVDPTNSSVAYLGAADGGVWKTTDGGQHWTPITDSQPSLSVGAIALDPTNSSIVYVGTGEGNGSGDNFPGVGILKSTDAGQTWTNIQGPFVGQFIGSLAVDPSNPQILLATAFPLPFASELFRSTDGGLTWTGNQNLTFTDVLFDPNHPGVAYASGVDTSFAVFKSTDDGATWTAIEHVPDTGRTKIALSGSTLYAAFGSGCAPGGCVDGATLVKSTDAGATWTQLKPPTNTQFCPAQCTYGLTIAVSPANPNLVFFGAINQIHSSDGGTTWVNDSALHADYHAHAFSANGAALYVGNDGGVWSTSNPSAGTGVIWTNLNTTLATLQFYFGLSVASGNPDIGLGGTQDNSTALFRGVPAWTQECTGDAFSTVIDPTNSNIMYCTNEFGGIFKSTDGFTSAPTEITPPNRNSTFETLLTLDPFDSSRLYTLGGGSTFVQQSNDGGSTWQQISPTLPFVFSIDAAPSDSNTIYLATQRGIAVTRNATSGTGATWQTFTAPDFGGFVQIAVDPHDPTTAYAVRSSTAFAGPVFKVTNSGATFTNISGNLPSVGANDIVVDPDQANTLYLATDVGVFSTTDGGSTWSTLVSGLPTSVVTSLIMDRTTRVLRAGTHGRSVWDLQLPPATGTGNGTLSGTVVNISTNAAISGATVSFSGGTTTTNASGFYQFTNVVPGTYSVTASHAGFFSSTQSATVNSGATTTLNFRLATGGKLAGTVTSSSGAAVSGATVTISGGSVNTSVTLTTSSTGAYATNFVPVGSYTITVSAAGFATQSKTATVNTGQTTTVNFTLAAAGGGTLSGTVVNISNGAAISGATVSFSGGSTTTNSSGFYQFTNVAAGTFSVTASHSGFFSSTQTATVNSGATTTLNFKLATGGKLAGTVTNSSGAAISGATVKISGGSVPTSVTLTTSSTGAYATNFVPVGTYTITVSAGGFATQSKTATVNTGQTTTVNFTLSASGGTGTLSGTVVDISNNAPISGATVSFSGGSTTTNSSGFYQFTNVAAGTFSVTASHSGFFSSTQTATVNSGATTTLNFKLATGGKIAGTVTNSSGAAVSGATVKISGGSVPTSVTLTTNSSGAYATNFIPVGTYTITVSATGFTTQSKTATVNTGQTTTVNFVL